MAESRLPRSPGQSNLIPMPGLNGAPGSPLQAIRARCLACAGDSMAEVRRCTVSDCPLHPYRHKEARHG